MHDELRFSDICRMALFRGFSEDFVRLLDLYFTDNHHPSGTRLVEQGRLQETFYIIISGEVEIQQEAAGTLISHGFLEAGQFFGEINLFDPGVATAHVIAATPVRTLQISNERFRSFISQRPELAADFTYQLAETIVKRFRNVSSALAEEMARPENLRLARQVERGPIV